MLPPRRTTMAHGMQFPRACCPDELNAQMHSRCEFTSRPHRGQRGPHRVVQHGTQESTLDVSCSIGEFRLSYERGLQCASLLVYLLNCHAKCFCGHGFRQLACLHLPKICAGVHLPPPLDHGLWRSCESYDQVFAVVRLLLNSFPESCSTQ